MDARGNLHLELAIDDQASRAVTICARRLHHATRTVARGTGTRPDELAEDALGHLLKPSASATGTQKERYQDHLVAFFDFKEGTGAVARDTSGLAPAMDLQLEGAEWLSNYGISIENGKAWAPAATSRKLYDHIADPDGGTQQYSIEAWVIPDNTDQEGPARIISYSRGTGNRN